MARSQEPGVLSWAWWRAVPPPQKRRTRMDIASSRLVLGAALLILLWFSATMQVEMERQRALGRELGRQEAPDLPDAYGLYRCENATGAVLWSLQPEEPAGNGQAEPHYLPEVTLFARPGSPWWCSFTAEAEVYP